MKQYNPTEQQAHLQQHPRKPIKTWIVYHCGTAVYENDSVRLCHDYRITNNLANATIKAKY